MNMGWISPTRTKVAKVGEREGIILTPERFSLFSLEIPMHTGIY